MQALWQLCPRITRLLRVWERQLMVRHEVVIGYRWFLTLAVTSEPCLGTYGLLASFWDMERHGRRVATFRRGAIDEHILRPLRNPRKIREREPESDRGSCTEKGQRHGDLSINVGRCFQCRQANRGKGSQHYRCALQLLRLRQEISMRVGAPAFSSPTKILRDAMKRQRRKKKTL